MVYKPISIRNLRPASNRGTTAHPAKWDMKGLAKTILSRGAGYPEGTPLDNEMFLDLGSRAAINRALLHCFHKRELFRVAKGMYVVPVVNRFGSSAPLAHLFIEGLSRQSGEDIVPSGATTANTLGLTTQVPVQTVYWTSGRSRKFNLGKQVIYLEHVPSWQLALAGEPSGEIVRALAWAGQEQVQTVLKQLGGEVPQADIVRVAQQASRFPALVGGRLESDCRHILTAVAAAKGTLE